MHVISLKKAQRVLATASRRRGTLRRWYRISKKAEWKNLAETRSDFPHADLAGVCTVFNIKGNAYRLISKIYYPNKTVLDRIVLTHPEYDKGSWKYDCEC